MKIPFNTPHRKRLAAVVAAFLSTAYLGFAVSQFAASWLGNETQLRSLLWAARLDPRDADFRYRLGRYYDLVARDPSSALQHYQAAVALNPHSARYWLDLASAYQVMGDTPRQTAAIERAIQADAMTPDVAWEAGNLYLVQGENDKALHEFGIVIANDNTLAGPALQYSWRINPDVDVLLHDVLPARADVYVSFLTLLENRQETDGAIKVWNALMRTRESFQVRDAFDYIRYLIQHKEVDQAAQAWRQIANRFGLSSYLPSSGNLIVNGNFGLDVLNAGFDWQYEKQSSVNLNLDPSEFHGGRRSLLIAFDGPGITEAGIYQFVGVQPNTTYEFTGYYKSGEMEGAGAPHFTIQDMYSQQIYYESEELKDAAFWKSANGEFTTGPDCKLVVLHIRRIPLGSPIRGKLWIDDFHLTKKQ